MVRSKIPTMICNALLVKSAINFENDFCKVTMSKNFLAFSVKSMSFRCTMFSL